MAKPLVRIGIDVDSDTWKTLLKVEKFDGVRTFNFLIDTSQPTVWLYLVGDSEELFGRLHDITSKRGGLPMKSAGEWRESSETFSLYFQSAVRAARFAIRAKEAADGPQSEQLVAKDDAAAATAARERAREEFERAFARDAEKLADLKESFEEEDIEYGHLGPAN